MTTKLNARLRKLLVLAMTSEQEGESLSALRAVRRWMAATGKGAEWVLDNVGVPPPPFILGQPVTLPWDVQLDYVNEPDSLVFLNDNEFRFVHSIKWQADHDKQWRPTGRQARWLNSIHTRLTMARGVMEAQRSR